MSSKYVFSYRRIKGKCQHCEEKNKGFLSKILSIFKKSGDECEFKWKSFTVVGHTPENYEEINTHIENGIERVFVDRGSDRNKMVLWFEDGGLKTISNWHDCELKLGTDWVLATKSNMEKESGQQIKLNIG